MRQRNALAGGRHTRRQAGGAAKANMGQRLGAAMLGVFITGVGSGMADMHRQRLANMAHHVRKSKLLTHQQLQCQPDGQYQGRA